MPQESVVNEEDQVDNHCYLETAFDSFSSFTSRLKMKYDVQLTIVELLVKKNPSCRGGR